MTIKEIMESFKPGSPAWEDAKTLTVQQIVGAHANQLYWIDELQPELHDQRVPLRPFTEFVCQILLKSEDGFKALGCEMYYPTGREAEGYPYVIIRNGEKVDLARFPLWVVDQLLEIVYEQQDIEDFPLYLNAHIVQECAWALSVDDILKSIRHSDGQLEKLEEVM